MSYNFVDFNSLLGKTLTEVEEKGDRIRFRASDGSVYEMYHDQDCCESVDIEDICGDLNDLIGSPILQAEESSNEDNPKDRYDEAYKWTFYRIATIKGQVVIRWYGTSNGYYSVSVSFRQIENN